MHHTTWTRLVTYVSHVGTRPDDDEESRLKNTILVVATLLISGAGLMWALLYAVGGEPMAGAIPFTYSVLSVVNLAVLARTGRIEFFRPVQLLMILFLPFLLMLALGGFVSGSAVVLWAFLGPLGVLLCWESRKAVLWFVAFLALVVTAGLLTPYVSPDTNLSAGLRTMLFVINICAVCLVAFVLLFYFVRQKDVAMRLAREKRDLERANLEQELLLRQSEKLATLGRLSAGVAHELNNPAAAVQRGSSQLDEAVIALDEARYRLGRLSGLDEHREAIDQLHIEARQGSCSSVPLGALERSDKESALESSLTKAGVENAWDYAATLVELGCELPVLDDLANGLEPQAFEAVIASLSSTAAAHKLLGEIGQSSARITEIVRALKTYTYLDQGPVQFLDVNEGLDNTLVMLRGKLKQGVDVERDYASNLPNVQGYGGELNQVWTNIIDNAIDAMDGHGKIRVRTSGDASSVVVEISDNGPGIPESVRSQVFDPFYTTKAMGEGTGLGLNISRNIVVQKHSGEISVESQPGDTRFTIVLPVAMTSQVPGNGHSAGSGSATDSP